MAKCEFQAITIEGRAGRDFFEEAQNVSCILIVILCIH